MTEARFRQMDTVKRTFLADIFANYVLKSFLQDSFNTAFFASALTIGHRGGRRNGGDISLLKRVHDAFEVTSLIPGDINCP